MPGLKEEVKNRKANQEGQKKEVTPEDRVHQKQKAVLKHYDIILALKSWVDVKIAMNQPEPVEPEPEEEPEPEPAKGAKGKKK